MARAISQREAHRLRRRVAELESEQKARLNRYNADYPGGHHIATFVPNEQVLGRMEAGHMLDAVFVAKLNGQNNILIYMVPTK